MLLLLLLLLLLLSVCPFLCIVPSLPVPATTACLY
jgi:hypothetical protein